jgi:hypothetical protein
VFFLLFNPIYNVGDYAMASTDAEVKLRYYGDTDLVTLDEAKQLAGKITGEEEFNFHHRPHEDFHNVYRFNSEKYSIDVDGISGMVMNFSRIHNPEGSTLNTQEYVKRSLGLLHAMGRDLLPKNQIQIKTEEVDGQFTISILPMFSDGTYINNDRFVGTTFVWKKESLMLFHERSAIYTIESQRNTRITNEDVQEILEDWYEALELEMTPFSLQHVQHGYSNRRVEIFVEMKNQDHVMIDGFTGEVISFSTNLDHEEDLPKMEEIILKIKDINPTDWDRTRAESSWVWSEKSQTWNHLFYQHVFGYYKGDTGFTYFKNIDHLFRLESHTRNSDGREAIRIIENQLSYKPYATRAEFTFVVDENEQIRKAWLVIVQPFGSTEHRLYLVDVETNRVDSLYE